MRLPRIPQLARGGLARPVQDPRPPERVRPLNLGLSVDNGPFDELHALCVFSARDWAARRDDAWLYGIIVGWGDALPEVAERHAWDAETAARLRRLHIAYVAADRTFDGAEAAALDPWPCPNPDDPEGCYCPGDGPCIADEMSQA